MNLSLATIQKKSTITFALLVFWSGSNLVGENILATVLSWPFWWYKNQKFPTQRYSFSCAIVKLYLCPKLLINCSAKSSHYMDTEARSVFYSMIETDCPIIMRICVYCEKFAKHVWTLPNNILCYTKNLWSCWSSVTKFDLIRSTQMLMQLSGLRFFTSANPWVHSKLKNSSKKGTNRHSDACS